MDGPKSILITGASSGIGESLALEYAATGVHLALCGRDQTRLTAVAEQCRLRHATVCALVIDVTQQIEMEDWIKAVDLDHPLDLVIANAGISGGTGNQGENEAQARAIFEVNLGGVLNTIWPAIHHMRPRKSGHIVVVSSLAAFTPLPGAPAYSASKSAVKVYAEALNGSLKDDGITVTSICPGFVESRITDKNNFAMPMLLTGPKAAQIIHKGLDKARSTHRISLIFPWPMAAASWLVGILPPRVRRWVLLKAPKEQ
ncbi:MAG: SDR family NAD(P)-dependent oxidoreductase [Magnetovibrio sp.]|nr:SDR family NAD(P)-dependent oxidoreductase [Magnetovibrio sp.]